MSFPRYQEYKDSGVEWLGEVPEHWNVIKLRHALESAPCYGVLVPDFEEDGVPMLRITDMEDGNADRSSLNRISKALSAQYSRTILEEGDVVLSVVGTIGEAFQVDATLAGVNLSRAVARIQTNEDLAAEFLCWVFQTIQFQRYVDLTCVGAAQRVLNMRDLSAFQFAEAPINEQVQLAAFLDCETAKIDALVAEQRRLMDLLKEKRQAVISHTVTQGLNPYAPMKPSGIEWLGDVPEHWEVGPLKRFWSVTDCKHVTAEFVDDGIPLASIREVQSRWVTLENAKCTTEHFYELLIEGGRQPLPGDLIFSRNATVGEVAQVHADHPRFAMGQDVVLLRKCSTSYSSDYLQHVIRSPIIILQLANMMIGSTFKRINVEEIRSFLMPSPPSAEQAEIATFLEIEIGKFDTLTTEAQRAIDLLQERRTALISASVTGQIDVRLQGVDA